MRALPVILLVTLVPSLAQARKKAAVLEASLEIVIDQSEGMAAKSKGSSTFHAVMEAAKKAVEDRTDPASMAHVAWRTTGGVDSSLSAAGEAAACDSTKLIVPEGASAAPVLQVELKEKARGPLPLAAAIEAAAADRAHDSRQRSLLVITSGEDGCGRDVCNTAADVRTSAGLGAVKVLLLSNDSEAAARLSCLGQVTVIHGTHDLADRIGDAIDSVTNAAQVTVVAAKGDADLAADVELFAGSDTEPVVRGHTHESFPLLAGVYQVHVKVPKAEGSPDEAVVEGWRRDVEFVAGAALTVRIPLGAQQGRLTALVSFNGAVAPAGTSIAVLRLGDTQNPVATGRAGEELRLPPGRYDIRATIPAGPLDNVELWKPQVHLLPGEPLQVKMAAAQERGSLRADVSWNGDPLNDAVALLVPAGAKGTADAVFTPGKSISVATGLYTVTARFDTPLGKVEARSEPVTVKPDELAVAPVELGGLGRVKVDVAGRKSDDELSVGFCKVGEETPVGSVDAFTEYFLPAGTYDVRVEEHAGKKDSKVYWKREVKIVAGEKAIINVKTPK